MAKKISEKDLQQFRDSKSKFRNRDTVLVDESGRISELEFGELLPRLSSYKRLGVFGDAKQGGPYSPRNRELSSIIDLLESLAYSNAKGVVKRAFLNKQYRMVFDIGRLVSNFFYDGMVHSRYSECGRNIFCHSVKGNLGDCNSSLCCIREARLAIKYAETLLHAHSQKTVAILCYYNFQMMFIRRSMNTAVYGRYLRVSTVDGYIGKEADYVLVSTCAQKGLITPHVASVYRACVATSRGRRRLIIFGDVAILERNEVWSPMLRDMVHIEGNHCDASAVRQTQRVHA